MRILKPEIAREREERLLRWIINEFVETRQPIGSELVSQKAGFGLSSASVRNMMKKLEDEGYLYSPHTSGGRMPTDKAYRFYVDYLSRMQKMAVVERERIEREYQEQMRETDQIMAQTSRLLAMMSHSAGFVFMGGECGQRVARVDFIPLSPRQLMAVVVTEAGSVRHWPVRLNADVSPTRLHMLSSFLNEEIAGLPLKDAQRRLYEVINSDSMELRDVAELARQFLCHFEKQGRCADDLYIEGMSQLAESIAPQDGQTLGEMLRVMEEKNRFAGLLEEQMRGASVSLPPPGGSVQVTIGAENELREMKNLSMISTTYRVGDKTLGLLGILGPRHMEYGRMISLVNFMRDLMEHSLNSFDALPSSGPAEETESPPQQARSAKAGRRGRRKNPSPQDDNEA